MARLTEVVDGIYEIAGLGFGRVYFIDGDEPVLVDTNNPGRGVAIVGALEASGRSIESVGHIVLTHWHPDHAGSVAALAERSGARVYAGAADAPFISGAEAPPPFRRAGLLGPLLAPRMDAAASAEPATVHQELHDGDELAIAGGMRVIDTPGHTPGHVSLLLPERGLAFIGDAYFNWPGMRMGLSVSIHDPGQAQASLRKLGALDFDLACFGHGPPLLKGASAVIRRFAEGLS
jgi:glyoxylase-like metal-dependent hydrolase (beta-lactamase superfamily II)